MVTLSDQCPGRRWPLRSQYQPVRCRSLYPEPIVYVLPAFRAPTGADDSSHAGIDMRNPSRHVYSRYTQQVSTRVEQILSRINVSDVETHVPRMTLSGSLGWLCTYLFIWPGCFIRCMSHDGFPGSRQTLNFTIGPSLLSTKKDCHQWRLSRVPCYHCIIQDSSKRSRSDRPGFRIPTWRSLLVRNTTESYWRIKVVHVLPILERCGSWSAIRDIQYYADKVSWFLDYACYRSQSTFTLSPRYIRSAVRLW